MMKKLFTWMLIGAWLFSVNNAFSQHNYWNKQNRKASLPNNTMTVQPDKYAVYTLETNQLRQILNQAGKTFQQGVQITLPSPDNKSLTFTAWETPVMEPALAAQHPDFKTYTATLKGHPGVSAKLDFTSYGFRAMIYDGSNTYFIDPYDFKNSGYYLVFYSNQLTNIHQHFTCDINAHPDLLNPGGTPVQIKKGTQSGSIQNGAVRHHYRIALACTGEYAILATNGAPTPNNLLSLIITTVNRVNGVYERAFSVDFTLVSGESSVLFADPNTDPYACSGSLECLLSTNQGVVDGHIGSANYDVAQVLCTAGGGLGALSAVCDNTRKAEGASSSSGPDDFSTILHEMGHQFSARHTFNAVTGGCQGNIDTSSSYEPGSGSTIMSYGGACPPNNIVPVSDNYFHVATLLQVHGFLVNNSTCGTTSPGYNSVILPTNLAHTYNIPANTPFELKAPQITPSQANASIVYNWEQYDLGNFGGTEAQDGQATSGPIMRSYPPSDSNNIRQFPVSAILDGSYSAVGERLPENPRTVDFKFTAKSVLLGWGSFAVLDSVVKLNVTSQGPFRVTKPDISNTADPGDTILVKWEVNNVNQNPINCQAVNIYLSLDNGQTFPILLMGNVPDTGSCFLIIPDVYTLHGLIKVQGVANIFYDVAKGKLTINGTNGIKDTYLKNHLKLFPNPATDWLRLEYSGNDIQNLVVNMYTTDGRLVWTGKMKPDLQIPVSSLARGNYRIQIINSKTAANTSMAVSLK